MLIHINTQPAFALQKMMITISLMWCHKYFHDLVSARYVLKTPKLANLSYKDISASPAHWLIALSGGSSMSWTSWSLICGPLTSEASEGWISVLPDDINLVKYWELDFIFRSNMFHYVPNVQRLLFTKLVAGEGKHREVATITWHVNVIKYAKWYTIM